MSQFMGFTKTVLKNLFAKPVTTSYPAAPKGISGAHQRTCGDTDRGLYPLRSVHEELSAGSDTGEPGSGRLEYQPV